MLPIMIIDTSRVRPGRFEHVRALFGELARFVEANEPRAVIYSVFLDARDSSATVLQVHPDSTSAEFHMQVASLDRAGPHNSQRLSHQRCSEPRGCAVRGKGVTWLSSCSE